MLDPDDRPVTKGTLCATSHGFNLQAATRIAANDKPGRERLCRYILRPPLANDRLRILDDGNVRLDFKKPWSNGTSSVDLPPLALIARLAALVPTPRRHLTRYCGVLSSHSRLRSRVVPQAEAQATATEKPEKPARKSKYIPWAELLRRTFGFEVVCQKCQAPLRLVALVKTQDIAKKILTAMHLPTEVPELHPARPPPGAVREARGGEDWPEDWLS